MTHPDRKLANYIRMRTGTSSDLALWWARIYYMSAATGIPSMVVAWLVRHS